MRLISDFFVTRNTKVKKVVFFLLKILVVSVIGFTLHIILKNRIDPIISSKMASIAIKKPPYGLLVTFFAYLTAPLPAVGMIVLYYLIFIKKYITYSNRYFLNGVVFAVIFLISQGQLIRQPVMNALVGNPFSIVLLMMTQTILPIVAMSILIAYLFRKEA